MTKSSRLGSLALLTSTVFLAAGCGGFSGSHSVSPASMLIPGLVQAPDVESADGVKVPSEKVDAKQTAALNQ